MKPRRWCAAAAVAAVGAGGPLTRADTAVDIAAFSVVPQEVAAGARATGSIRLDAAAPARVDIALRSESAAIAHVPPTVSAPAGTQTVSFTVQTIADAAGCTRIVGRLGTGVPRAAELFVLPPAAPPDAPVRLRLDSNTVVAGGSVQAQVDLPRPAPPSGITVAIGSGSSVARAPSSVHIPAGTSSQRFLVSTSTSGASTCALLTATAGGYASRVLLRIVGVTD